MLVIITIGILAGIVLSIPAGPASILILRNSSLYGYKHGAIAFTGFLSAEIIYLVVYVFGLSQLILSSTYIHEFMIILGGGFIIFLGIKNLFHSKRNINIKADLNLSNSFMSTFIITIFNPAILLYFAALVSFVIKLSPVNFKLSQTTMFLISAEVGTTIWFAFLIFMACRISEKFQGTLKRPFEFISSILLILLGLFIISKNIYGGIL